MRKHLATAAFTLLIASPAVAQVSPAPSDTAPGATISTPGGAIPNDTSNTLNRPSTTDGHAGSQACEKMAGNAAGGAAGNAAGNTAVAAGSASGSASAAHNANCPPGTKGATTTPAPALQR